MTEIVILNCPIGTNELLNKIKREAEVTPEQMFKFGFDMYRPFVKLVSTTKSKSTKNNKPNE
jgi:hypothetical protein